MNREDFEILKSGIIYFDNGATTLKPKVLSEATSDYYNHYSANSHRGDYDISLKVNQLFEETRELVRRLINANDLSEIVFTSGATDSLNKIVFGYFENYLTKDDEIILSHSEHASNILPWFELKDKLDLVVKYAPLDKDLKIDIDNFEKIITPKTKVISLAYTTNVVGDTRDIKKIIDLAHKHNILVVVDASQTINHKFIDVQTLDIDFLVFSAHKMCGPTGLGILYGKRKLLNNIKPIIFGGGMNASFNTDGLRIYSELPYLLEAGTPNIAGILGFGAVLKYLNKIGYDNIDNHVQKLHKYALEKLKEVDNIIIYNENSESGIITFNLKDVFAQDLAIYLNKYHICVRAGSHCAKMLKDDLGIKNTCRISFYFYNTFEEIDALVKVLKNPNLKDELI